MGSFKKDNLFIGAAIAIVENLGMGVVNHPVILGSQKEDMSISIAACQIVLDFQFLWMHVALQLDVSANDAEETGEHALKETIERHAHLRLRQLLAGCVKTGKGRISNNYICLCAQQSAHCTHTSAPHCHLKTAVFQEFYGDIHLTTLVLPQRNELLFHPIPAAVEVETGKTDLRRQKGKLRKALVPTGAIAVEIEHDVLDASRSVEGEREGDVKNCVFESTSEFSGGVDERIPVEKPGRSNEHVAIFIDAFLWIIAFLVEGSVLGEALA